jgi:general secretion pathway protein B
MSLILEALRKSEAERRRGQTPDLLTDAVPVAAATRRAPPNWTMLIPVIGAALITLLLVVWWLRPSAEPVSNGEAARDPSVAGATTAAHELAANSPSATSSRTQPSLSPPVSGQSAPAALTPPVATPTSPATTASIREPATAPAAAPAPAPAPAPVAVEPKPALTSPAQVASLEPPPAPASANPPAFASPDAPVKLADLSSEDRAQLPTLKVSMHMWSPDAGSRFAIIDGTRVNEGDRVGEATIEAIQQDSVMLSWHGRQIRLPIR